MRILLFMLTSLAFFAGISRCQFDLQDYGVLFSQEHLSKYFWGTYKPNLYFAMRERLNTTNVFGIMWYDASSSNLPKIQKMRHECKKGEDNIEWAKDKFGNKIMPFHYPNILSKQVDICPSCQNTIARIVNLMRYVNINADKIEEDVYISLKNASTKNSKGE